MGGKEIRRIAIIFASAFGGGCICAQVCGMEFLGHPLCKLGAGILICVIAFGKQRDFPKCVLLFFLSSMALGGAVWAIEFFSERGLMLKQEVLYTQTNLRLLLVALILSYCLISVMTERMFTHKKTELVPLHIMASGNTVKLTALVDTGNTLTEPISNRPVVVAEGTACRSLLPCDLSLEKPIEAMEYLKIIGVKGFSLLPYRAVGVSNGLLLAIRAERIVVGKQERKNLLIALSPTPVSDGGGYQALIGGGKWC
jgi:stage II sporulation protein GA (sporulation sigma-E factor processing peptidase)